MEFNGAPQSWWTDRNGVRKYDFTGGDSDVSKCQCGLNDSCLDHDLLCNCNSLSPTETSDEGDSISEHFKIMYRNLVVTHFQWEKN